MGVIEIQVMGNLLAAYAELEAMKVANAQIDLMKEFPKYPESSFWDKAREINDITNKLFI